VKLGVAAIGDGPHHPAQKLVLKYFFWSADVPGNPSAPGRIPMRPDKVPQDIVFSIRILANAFSYNLLYIQISIPLGPPLQNFDDNPGPLNEHYTVLGGSMLSNLRFNSVVQISDDRNEIIIRLIPRSVKGYVKLSQHTDLSFMLRSIPVRRVCPS
jgi:hypothetical protein